MEEETQPDSILILREYASQLRKLVERSQDTFEKQLSYISGGAIGASMLIVEKFYEKPWNTELKWTIILGWILLTFTLLANLISHLYASNTINKTIGEISRNEYNEKKAERRWSKIHYLNIGSVVSLFCGILLIVVFISYNSLFMGNTNKQKISLNPAKKEEFGYVSEPPPKVVVVPVSPSPKPEEQKSAIPEKKE